MQEGGSFVSRQGDVHEHRGRGGKGGTDILRSCIRLPSDSQVV